jgi:hypothetical protein
LKHFHSAALLHPSGLRIVLKYLLLFFPVEIKKSCKKRYNLKSLLNTTVESLSVYLGCSKNSKLSLSCFESRGFLKLFCLFLELFKVFLEKRSDVLEGEV